MKNVFLNLIKLLILCISCIGIFSCASPSQTTSSSAQTNSFQVITGTIHYPNTIYFPSKIRIEITLSSLDNATMTEKTLAVQNIRNPQKFPVNFTLRYDEREIVSSETHHIYVEIFQENTDTPYLTSIRKYPVNLFGPASSGSIQIDLVTVATVP